MPKFVNNVDLNKNELQNARIQNLATAPSSPVAGQIYFNTTDKHYYIYNGTAWVQNDGVPTHGHPISDVTGLQTALDGKSATGHTHTASFITDLTSVVDSQIKGTKLDQIAYPTAPMNMGSQKLTNVADPVSAQDAATKSYVDTIAQGISAKASVRVATTANINLASFSGTIDGVTLAQGDRVLVKNQTNPAENGIYSLGQPSVRFSDIDTWAEHISAYVWVQEGTTQADTGWLCTANAGGTLGTTALPWVQFSGAGQISVGNGLSKSGNTINLVTGDGINDPGVDGNISIALETNSGLSTATGKLAVGAGTGITVGANSISVANPKLKFTADCGTSAAWTITHNLGTQDVQVQIFEKATMAQVFADISNATANTVTVTFASAPTTAQYHAVILG